MALPGRAKALAASGVLAMNDWLAMLVLLVLLFGNAFFVGAEFALISARRSVIEPRAEAGDWRARVTLSAIERVSLMMAGAQLGITACSLGIGSLGEPALAHLLEPVFEAVGLPAALIHPVSFTVAISVVVYLHMVFGEMLPKNIAMALPEESALWLGPMMYGLVMLLKPVIWLLNALADACLRLVGVTPVPEVASAFDRDQVAALVSQSHREGLIGGDQVVLLTGALNLGNTTAGDVAIPRSELRTLPFTATCADVEQAVVETGFSRFPLVGADGFPQEYVHIKDVMEKSGPIPAGARRPLPFIDSDLTLAELVEALRQAGSHLGCVIDQYSPIGVVTLEDALERLIGEVVDPAHRQPGLPGPT